MVHKQSRENVRPGTGKGKVWEIQFPVLQLTNSNLHVFFNSFYATSSICYFFISRQVLLQIMEKYW